MIINESEVESGNPSDDCHSKEETISPAVAVAETFVVVVAPALDEGPSAAGPLAAGESAGIVGVKFQRRMMMLTTLRNHHRQQRLQTPQRR
ncbi:hypothetical protein L1887_36846 [Cichorium endivia]|nr:hypothetical protein L1887_36846 [Cichorium endivia]